LCHTTQHGAVLIIFPLNLQTITMTRMLSSGRERITDTKTYHHRCISNLESLTATSRTQCLSNNTHTHHCCQQWLRTHYLTPHMPWALSAATILADTAVTLLSPKLPKMCQVGCKTLLDPIINHDLDSTCVHCKHTGPHPGNIILVC